MFRRYSAAITAFLVMAVTSLASAQQAASDSTKGAPGGVRARDERAVTADTVRLHREIAVRDSARATLARDQAQTQAEEARIDTLQAALKKDRQATPRDTAAINRDLATLTRMRKKLDSDLDRDHREKARLQGIETKVKKESDAAIEAHHDIRQDRPVRPAHHDTTAHH
jgi:chromosome segregation ATPase